MCKECYADDNDSRRTPLYDALDCLRNHTQYICGTCGRCICIEHKSHRDLQRWQFPFKSLEIAKLYLRTADYSLKKACGIYEIKNDKGRVTYKIFAKPEDLQTFLQNSKDKSCTKEAPVFMVGKYQEYPNTQMRKLTIDEIEQYMSER